MAAGGYGKHGKPGWRRGFTLIELAIVLVVIGAIAGGVVAGREIMYSAKLKTVVDDTSQYSQAVRDFKRIYGAMPGDMHDAQKRFGGSASIVEGNGNGVLEGAEMLGFWQHLSSAGLISGSYDGATAVPGVGVPQAQFAGTGFYVDPGFGGSSSGDVVLALSRYVSGVGNGRSALKPEDVWNIDKKYDDGKPESGFIRAADGADATANACVTAGGEFALSNKNVTCAIGFIIARGEQTEAEEDPEAPGCPDGAGGYEAEGATRSCDCPTGMSNGVCQEICRPGGVWELDADNTTCAYPNCSTVYSDANGTSTGCTYPVAEGASCTINCNAGYESTAGGTTYPVTCSGGAMDNAGASCTMNCSAALPDYTPSATVALGTFSGGVWHATITCNTGATPPYRQVAGTPNITCDPADDFWTPLDMECRQECDAANPSILHGSVAVQWNGTTQQWEANSTCEAGYTLDGSVTQVTCAEGGTVWVGGPLDNCVANECTPPQPPDPANGSYGGANDDNPSYPGYLVSELTCSAGYTASVTPAKCLPGGTHWDDVGECQPEPCQVAQPVVANGVPLPATLDWNETDNVWEMSVDCNAGYMISGSNLATCDANGASWTAPTCIPGNCADPMTELGWNPAIYEIDAGGTTLGSTRTARCASPPYWGAPKTITCQANFTWSNIQPSCVLIDCSAGACSASGSPTECTGTEAACAAVSCAGTPGSFYTMTTQSTGLAPVSSSGFTPGSATYGDYVEFVCDKCFGWSSTDAGNPDGRGAKVCDNTTGWKGNNNVCTGPFKNVTNWAAADPVVLGVTVDKGYSGGAFDGRYIYISSYRDQAPQHGTFLRYDTQASFTAAASWTDFNPSTSGLGANTKGYATGVYDGARYVYFTPMTSTHLYANMHGAVLRYDTQGAFDNAASWAVYDAGANGVGTDPDGYMGAVIAGRYIYFVPLHNGTDFHGEVLRYDTQGAFNAAASWTTYNPAGNGVGVNARGYTTAVKVGNYIYFAPYANSGGFHGEMLRYNTTGAFNSAASWTAYDPGANGVGVAQDGYGGVGTDGRYLYFAPLINNVDFHGEVMRYDTQGAFNSAASWSAYDPGSNGVGTDPDGYGGVTYGGRYIYFAPFHNGTMMHGEVLRYDTLGAYNAASSWETFDFGSSGGGVDPDGFGYTVYDGRYIYFIQQHNGTAFGSEIMRYDTQDEGIAQGTGGTAAYSWNGTEWSATLSCQSGYSVSGSTGATCSPITGTWSAIGTCMPDCVLSSLSGYDPLIMTPAGTTTTQNGSSQTVSCGTGYSGTPTNPTCNASSWTGSAPTCMPDCEIPTKWTPNTAGAEFQVNDTEAGNQEQPAAALLNNMFMVMVYTSPDANGKGVYARIIDRNGAEVIAEFQVNVTTAGDQQHPDVAVLSSGNFVVVYDSDTPLTDASGKGVVGRVFDAFGVAQTGEFLLHTTTAGNQVYPKVAGLSSGNIAVSWDDDNASRGRMRVLDGSTGAGLIAEFELGAISDTTTNSTDISAGGGSFIVAYEGVNFRIFNDSGVNQVGPVAVGETGTALSIGTSYDSERQWIIAWRRALAADTSDYGIGARIYNYAGVARSSLIAVNDYVTNAQVQPAAFGLDPDSDRGGVFGVVWAGEGTGDTSGVFMRLMNSNGGTAYKLGAEEQLVNTTTAGTQAAPVAADFGLGNFMIAYESDNVDAGGKAVAARVYTGTMFAQYATIQIGSRSEGTVRDYICDSGYTGTPTQITCDSGAWTGAVPTCVLAPANWVVVGDGGNIRVSVDLLTWNTVTSAHGTDDIFAVGFNGSNQWVAVGANGKVSSSTDGITWTAHTGAHGTSGITGVAHNYQFAPSGRWVAVGMSGKLSSSTDGVTWVQQADAHGSSNIRKVLHNRLSGTAGRWVAVGAAGLISYSNDGIVWSIAGNSTFGTNTINDIAYDASLDMWTAVGVNNQIATSTDGGVTWTARASVCGAGASLDTVYCSQTGMCAADCDPFSGSTGMQTTANGTLWTQRTAAGTSNIQAVTHNNVSAALDPMWVLGDNNGRVMRSPDGIVWTLTGTLGINIRDIAYKTYTTAPPLFPNWVAVGRGGKIAVSDSGITWSAATSTFGTDNIYGVSYDNTGTWVAVGQNGRVSTSPDGITWTPRTGAHGTEAINDVAHNQQSGGRFVAVGNAGLVSYSDNGVIWTSAGTLNGGSHLYAVAHNGLSGASGQWVAAGQGGKISTSANGSVWTAQCGGAACGGLDDIVSVVHNGVGQWVAVGANGKAATSANGTAWAAAAMPFSNCIINTVDHDAASNMYVAGSSPGCNSKNIATSNNGTAWGAGALTPNMWEVKAVKHNDLAGVAGGLWVGGDSNGIIASSTNGTTWTARSSTIFTSGFVEAIAYRKVSTANWVAVGDNGIISTSINGTSWAPVTGAHGTDNVYSVAYNGSNLWAAVGAKGKISTSPNGITWTLRATLGATINLRGVAHNRVAGAGGRWVAAGEDGGTGVIYLSSDGGATWTAQAHTMDAIRDVRWAQGANLFVVTGENGKMASSPDGATWTDRTSNCAASSAIDAIYYSNAASLYIAACGATSDIQTSTNLTAWTDRTEPFSGGFVGAIVHNEQAGVSGMWVASNGSQIASSPTGTSWTTRLSWGGGATGGIAHNGLTGANSLFVYVGANGAVYTSSDGITWSPATGGHGTNMIWEVAYRK